MTVSRIATFARIASTRAAPPPGAGYFSCVASAGLLALRPRRRAASRALAKAALKTMDLNFNRWCA